MRFWHQNVASRVYALLSVIRQQMSAFDPFRGGGRPKRTMSAFFTVFLIRELPLVQMGVVQVQLGLVQMGIVQMGVVKLGVVQVHMGQVQYGVVQLGVVQLD